MSKRHRSTLGTSLIVTAILLAPSFLAADEEKTLTYPDEGAELGGCWDSDQESQPPECGICIVFKPFHTQEGNESTVSMQNIDSKYSFSEQIDVSASESVNALVDPNDKATAKESFSDKISIDLNHRQWAVHAVVDSGEVRVAPPDGGQVTFTKEIQDLLNNETISHEQKMRAFKLRCGDSYVMSIKEGAELVALLTDTSVDMNITSTEEESFEINDDLGGYNETGKDTVNEQLKGHSITLHFLREGGKDQFLPSGVGADGTSTALADLHKAISNLESAADNPWKYKLTVKNYKVLLEEFDLDHAARSFQTTPYERIAREYGKWESLHTKVSDILKTTDRDTGCSGAYLLGRGVVRKKNQRADPDKISQCWRANPSGDVTYLEELQTAAQERMHYIQSTVAPDCLEKAKKGEKCTFGEVTVTFNGTPLPKSDLEELSSLPPPISLGNPTSAFMSRTELEDVIENRWITPVKKIRKFAQNDPDFYWDESSIDDALDDIPFDSEATIVFSFKNLHDGKCLTVASDESARLMSYDCNGATTQFFTYDPADDARLIQVQQTVTTNWNNGWSWHDFSPSTQVCLNVRGAGTTNGTHVIGWPCESEENMKFEILPGTQHLQIKASQAGKCLRLDTKGSYNPTQVIIQDCDGSENEQLWSIYEQKVLTKD